MRSWREVFQTKGRTNGIRRSRRTKWKLGRVVGKKEKEKRNSRRKQNVSLVRGRRD
jgi:hypothetical protein